MFSASRKGARIAFNRNHALGTLHQQRARQPAGAGANFNNRHIIQLARRTRNAAGKIEIEKKILSKAFLGCQPMPLNHLAQGRQTIVTHDTAFRAMPAAIRMALISDKGLALPVPASERAVP